jgi:hypothetical protein
MRIRVDGTVHEGPAVELSGVDLNPAAVVRAVRGEPSPVTVEAPEPGPLHGHVGHIAPARSLSTRAALAAAARSRGMESARDDELARLRDRLAAVDPDRVSTCDQRERLAEAGEAVDRLRERVARQQGRLRSRREAGEDTAGAERALNEAVRELSEAETERAAAEQALERARERRRAARDAREERLRLQDRIGNLERAARRELADRLAEEFRAATRELPGGSGEGEDADPVSRALAVVAIGEPAAPVVLDCDRFPDAPTAVEALSARVVRL